MRRMTYLAGTILIALIILSPKTEVNSQVATATPELTGTLSPTPDDFPPPHSYMIVSTSFELESLLDDYAKSYPNIGFVDYRIVYKGENEWPDTPYTYIIVFRLPTKYKSGLSFRDYIDAWMKLHPGNKIASAAENDALPPLKR
jgi:hypothetical protein